MPRDLFQECFDGPAQGDMSPEDFQQVFCRRCRNYECVNVGGLTTKWHRRISTQVDRIFTNPKFTDPNDPDFEHIRNMPFKDMVREAMKLEIADARGDWEIPTEADAVALASGSLPTAAERKVEEAVQEEQEAAEPPVEDAEPQVIWETEVFGTPKRGQRRKPRYRVALEQVGAEEPAWTCTCPAFKFRKDEKENCKHIQAMIPVRFSEVGDAPAPEPPEPPMLANPPPPTTQPPAPAPRTPAVPGPEQRGFQPRAQNTPFPTGGIMIGGGPPPEPEPEHDPWALPADHNPNEIKIPVGGKVRLGLGKKKE